MAAPKAGLLETSFARHRKGDVAAAERGYRAVIKAQPGNPDALYLLGMLCLDKGRAAEAAKFLARAIGAAAAAGRRVDRTWRLACGSALQRAGRHEDALGRFDAVLAEAPADVDALFCRATALQDLGRQEDAIAEYTAVLEKCPEHGLAASNLGLIYRDGGDPKAALRMFERAVAAEPGDRDAQINLGRAYMDVGLAADALPLLRQAAVAGPYDSFVEEKLAACLMQINLIDELETRAEAIYKDRPGDPAVMCRLAHARQARGDSESAVSLFGKALVLDPSTVGAHVGLAEIPGEAGRDDLIVEAERLLSEGTFGEEEQIALRFALGRHCAARGDYTGSFAAYSVANEARKKHLAAQGYRYDRAQITRLVDATIRRYGADAFDGEGADGSDMPLFIVGMPRSGTTLTEQILANHPAVFGAGELPFMRRASAELRRRFGYPEGPVPANALRAVAAAYLDPLARLGQGAQRVTDKMPGNFLHIGLIATLFPGARIVHCRRDPTDTCLSCFMQNFGAAGLSWSCDFGDMAHEYCEYRRLMDHWRSVLPPGRMLEIDYEDTVADLEGQARRLVEFTGLEWNEACLRFYEAKGAVITASRTQVRQKIYTGSVGRWRRYGDAVRPLAEALAACGCGPAGG